MERDDGVTIEEPAEDVVLVCNRTCGGTITLDCSRLAAMAKEEEWQAEMPKPSLLSAPDASACEPEEDKREKIDAEPVIFFNRVFCNRFFRFLPCPLIVSFLERIDGGNPQEGILKIVVQKIILALPMKKLEMKDLSQ